MYIKYNRKYLLESNYCSDAIVIYVNETKSTYTLEEFKKYLSEYDDSRPLCPKCGSKLDLKMNRKDETEFYGCSNFPKCKYTRKI